MRVVNCGSLRKDDDYINAYDLSLELIKDISPVMKEKYKRKDIDIYLIYVQTSLAYILRFLPEIKNKRVLDLGSGLNYTENSKFYYDPDFEPWLCRGLKLLGANPLGVDIGYLKSEEFDTLEANLLIPDSFLTIPTGSVDLAHAWMLFSSPELEKMGSPKELYNTLIPQLERILKPDGFFIYYD